MSKNFIPKQGQHPKQVVTKNNTNKRSPQTQSAMTDIEWIYRVGKTPNTETLTPEIITSLQQTHGNQFVLRLIDQSKQISQTSESSVNDTVIQRNGTDTLVKTGLGTVGGVALGGLVTWLTGLPSIISTSLFGILGGVITNMLSREGTHVDSSEESRRNRLEDNSFRTSAGLETYGEGLYKGFYNFLEKLTEDDSWLDGGAGEAQALYDYYKEDGEAQITAINYKLPKNQYLINEMIESSGINFSSLEGDFEELFEEGKLKAGKYKLITDYNGILMYSRHPDQDLLKYLRLLKPGGRLYATTSDIKIFDDLSDYNDYVKDTSFKPKQERAIMKLFQNWIGNISGVDVIKIHPLTLERNDDEVNVPELKLLDYDGSTSPPRRLYTRM